MEIWLNRGLGKWGFVCEWGANIQEVYANFQQHASYGNLDEIIVGCGSLNFVGGGILIL